MHKLIGANNRVNYGCIDDLINFNHDDFSLKNIMGGKAALFGRRFSASSFNFIGISSGDIFTGIGAVHLGYLANIFVFVYEKGKGLTFDFSRTVLPKNLCFPMNPDEHEIFYEKRGVRFSIKKSHKKGLLEIDCSIKDKLVIRSSSPFSLKNKPLRVLNPSCGDPTRFTFTEKCPLIKVKSASVVLNGTEKIISPEKTSVLYDWSGGYLNRFTHWFWAAFSGESSGINVGANFAAMVNETFYPENAYWIGGKRTRVPQVIFDFDMYNPQKGLWKIFTEDGRVNLTFKPIGERKKKMNLYFIKLQFRQFTGEYSGTVTDASGKKIKIKNLTGVAEIHLSKW